MCAAGRRPIRLAAGSGEYGVQGSLLHDPEEPDRAPAQDEGRKGMPIVAPGALAWVDVSLSVRPTSSLSNAAPSKQRPFHSNVKFYRLSSCVHLASTLGSSLLGLQGAGVSVQVFVGFCKRVLQ